MRRPDLFIVGAPKSGTTAMHAYLGQHPDVFMAPKELHFFGSDLTFRFTPRLTLDEYLAFFNGARGERRAGDASVRYLQSRSAAAEIRAFARDARILIMLRNPVDMMHAMHAELVFSGMEDIAEFADALAAEPDRARGERIAPGANIPQMLLYRDSARYAGQVERYLDTFPASQVRVLLYDDFAADTPGTVRETFAFLDVDPGFQPSYAVVNPSKAPRSRLLRDLLATPPPIIRRAARATLSRAARKRIYQAGQRLNARPAARQALDPQLRRRLQAEMADDVAQLGRLLGRDLSAWVA